jgi:hypothetical protein
MLRKPNPKTCEKCLHRYRKEGCPHWIEPENGFIETNIRTGEERVVQGCFFQVIPKLMAHVVSAANRPAAAMESFRNEMVKRIDQQAGNVTMLPRREQ